MTTALNPAWVANITGGKGLAGTPFLTSVAGTGTTQYFADQHGNPYQVRWDSMWGIIAQAGSGTSGTWDADMTAFCSTRASQGFNGFLTCPVNTTQDGANTDGSTWDGVPVFNSGDPTQLNSTFWTRVDYLIATAASYGLTVDLVFMFTYAMTTTGAPLHGLTTAQYQGYAAAAGARYASAPNVMWSFGDDYNNQNDAAFNAALTGLRGAGANQLISIENVAETTSRYTLSSGGTRAWGLANAQFNWCYSYGPSYNAVEFAYQEASPLCVLKADGWYDHSSDSIYHGRTWLWWSLSSGSRGAVYGNNDAHLWPANTISSGLLTSTTYYQTRLGADWDLFASWPGWHQLVADTSSALVTAGRGTHIAQYSPGGGGGTYSGGNDWVTASITPSGSLAVIYLPASSGFGGASAARTITVNGALMTAGYAAWWYDPASHAKTTATIAATYTTPGANSAGDYDWLLVLEGP